ncbi:uncharacterized protein LOC116346619 [Contarinia nasturtii]|uniref:uncharacterized protein LOC116346619 n=1 Tax=Contarinia nasturtii TaxID=265458 RepID=UPI0012D3DF36|nr:uncharacterized protein LOC116346619 [Contarinia nasturtii]
MVKTRRPEYVAKMARDLVLDIGEKCAMSTRNKCVKNLSHVDVTGFGFGAHIAGYTCEYLFKRTDGKVRILLALVPIKPALCGAADYVQVIHTSIKVGMWNQMGDVDIYVKYESDENLGPLNDVHGIAFFIHLVTSTKRLFIMAEMNNNTKPGIGKVLNSPTNIEPNECLIGVHGTLNVSHRGKKFGFLLKNGDPIFWRGVGNFKYIISGPQEVEEEDEDCILCCENKKKALLLPCKHMETCITCWFEWENAQTEASKCPICRREGRFQRGQ